MFRRESPEAALPPSATILSVSPRREDHEVLREILRDASWRIDTASTFRLAWQRIRECGFALVICERDLPRCPWQDLLAEALSHPQPPHFIVASQHADEYLWAEALNIGAYDVLAKPYQPDEVIRVFEVATAKWQYRQTPGREPLRSSAGA